MKCRELSKIKYKPFDYSYNRKTEAKIEVVGIDTEAYDTGKCFLICTSLGDSFSFKDFPACLFTRKYRDTKFVSYNLSYDEGAFLQVLSLKQLQELREKGRVKYKEYSFRIIPSKMLSIRKSNHTITIYDMYNFYSGSLQYNAEKYLGKSKKEMETKTFSKDFVKEHYKRIIDYCIQDCILVKELADLIINKFVNIGITPNRLYSTAYVSFQYFKKHTNYVTVKDIYKSCPEILNYALQSYRGGKFEVTEKGTGYFYSYDIVSAYPYEIANLIDIKGARIVNSKKHYKSADYGFILCKIANCKYINSPVAYTYRNVNIYPAGYLTQVITLKEYEYLIKKGVDIDIIDGYYIFIGKKTYPYKKEIEKLLKIKTDCKKSGDLLGSHTAKILMNSIYGKMIQLIEENDYFKTGLSFNPIYAAVITANTRIKMCELQDKYPEIISVNTDGVISKNKLPFDKTDILGDLSFETEGKGLLLGCGVYQIGDKTRIRGFSEKINLFELFDSNSKTVNIMNKRRFTWKETAFHSWNTDKINLFINEVKNLRLNFDFKRVWINDYNKFSDIFKYNVKSIPHFIDGVKIR